MEPNKSLRLQTPQTAVILSQFPEVEFLEAGHVAEWLSTRKDQLLVQAKEERIGSSLAKTVGIATAAIGAVCYATSPLAPLGAVLGLAGYAWALITDSSHTHTFNPIPFIRGGALDIIGSLGHSEARKEYFDSYDEFDQLKDYLAPVERQEYQMLRGHMALITEYLTQIDSGKRFYAYRWMCDQFILMRGSFPSIQQTMQHTSTMQFASPLLDGDRIKFIQDASRLPEAQPLIQDAPRARIQDAPRPMIADNPVAAFTDIPAIETQSVNFDKPAPNLIESITKRLVNTLIVGVPGVGKGIFVSNALEALKGKATVFYIDPKDDPKETAYFDGRVHKLYRKNIAECDPEETYEWVKSCLAAYDAFDAGTGIKLLVFDELAAAYSMLQNVKGAVMWLKSKMIAYASSGSSRGIIIWGISQNAHVSGIGFDGGARSIFTPIILISGDNIAASEQILAAQIIPSDKRINSTQIALLCGKSPVNRAVFHGQINDWVAMPELPNLSGFNRDKREFNEGFNPKDKVVTQLENAFNLETPQHSDDVPESNYVDGIKHMVFSIIRDSKTGNLSPDGIRTSRKWGDNKPSRGTIKEILDLLIKEQKILGDDEAGYLIK
jgi:hypothetical protein